MTFCNPMLANARLEGQRGAVSRLTSAQTVRWVDDDKQADPYGRGSSAKQEFCEALFAQGQRIMYVPAKRAVGTALHRADVSDAGEALFDGSTALFTILDSLNPSHEDDGAAQRAATFLKQLNDTMAALLGAEVVVRSLPAAKDVEISIDGVPMALRRLGAGVEQALVLALTLTLFPTHLLLIEEPENFLHPTVQRRFVEELLRRDGTSMVTTHSNHLLDIRDDGVAYFRTFRAKPSTSSLERLHHVRKYELLWDLGVRPSSLFECNAIIWVEGPSDAIYIRKWLKIWSCSEPLVEGIHFSFAFHAGALLDTFFIDWREEGQSDTQHIVNFCALHPNFFIVADRDATGSDLGHPYLARLAAQDGASRVLWVTEGKEIENYLPMSIFEEYLRNRASPRRSVKEALESAAVMAIPFWKIMNRVAGEEHFTGYPDKVRFAEWAASRLSDDDATVLDLKANIDKLGQFIRIANQGHRPAQQPAAPDGAPSLAALGAAPAGERVVGRAGL